MVSNLENALVLYGAGGHAKSVIGVIEAAGKWRLIGLVEDGAEGTGKWVLGYEVIGDRSCLPTLRASGITKGLVAVGDNASRNILATEMSKAGLSLVSIVHSSACIMKDPRIGAGSFVHAHTVIGPECVIGTNAIVSAMSVLGHESVIGDCFQFAPGVRVGGEVSISETSPFSVWGL